MKDRRAVLASAVGALPALALGVEAPPANDAETCVRPARGPDAHRFPNHVVVTHEETRALFYDDLLAGKTVLLHCMSIVSEPTYRSVERVAALQPLLAERLGRDLFMYSLTVDPERDTPVALRAFAARAGAGPGWLFLTGEPATMADLRMRLFWSATAHAAHEHDHEAGHERDDCAMAMLRYGNAAVGLWGAVPAKADPRWIVQRLAWVRARDVAAGAPRRRGPAPLRS
ncbi:MAG TPA: SCO family protein [Thermoanaerobaculia bacterium]|jgi:protein SCO1/2|nr:SCO family protein [Thermoanaerobaculia bacterium]